MVYEVRGFSVTIPANTPIATPQTTNLTMPVRTVRWVEVQVPDGTRGVVGWQLTEGGVPMWPQAGSPFVVVSGQTTHWDLDDALQSGAWQLTGYNIGTFPHTLLVWFGLDLAVTAESGGGLPPPLGTITGTGTGQGEGGTTLPPVPTLPVSLPPTFPTLPGQPGPPANPDTILVGVSSLGQVWLLDESGYSQVTDQSDIDALSQDGIPTVAIDGDTHEAIIAAAGMPATMTLGNHVLSGQLVLPARVLGPPPPSKPAPPTPPGKPVGTTPAPVRAAG